MRHNCFFATIAVNNEKNWVSRICTNVTNMANTSEYLKGMSPS